MARARNAAQHLSKPISDSEKKIHIGNRIRIWNNSSLWQEKQPRQNLSVPPAFPDMEVCRYTVRSWPLPQEEKPSLHCARWGKEYALNTCRKDLLMLIHPTLGCWPGGCSGVQWALLLLHFFLQIQKLPLGSPCIWITAEQPFSRDS